MRRAPKICGAVQVWRVRDVTYRLTCVLFASHPGDHAAAVLEHLDGDGTDS